MELQASQNAKDSAEAHCILIRREYDKLKKKHNATKKKRDKRFKPFASVLTSEEGLKERDEDRKKRKEKEEKEEGDRERSVQKEKERNAARIQAAASGVFSGALSTKTKGELEGIAAALDLSFDGTKQELTNRIKEHLDNHRDLQTNNHFTGLFSNQRKRTPLGTLTNAAFPQQQQQQHQQQQQQMQQVYAPYQEPFVIPYHPHFPTTYAPAFPSWYPLSHEDPAQQGRSWNGRDLGTTPRTEQ